MKPDSVSVFLSFNVHVCGHHHSKKFFSRAFDVVTVVCSILFDNGVGVIVFFFDHTTTFFETSLVTTITL